MSLDVEQLRSNTPGTQNVIHFNNAGASLMPKSVSETIVSYLDKESNYGGYETARKYRRELDQVYPNIADFINADSQEIALQQNATMAWNMAFFSIPFEDGDRILTSVSEYASNYIAYLKLQKQIDISIDVIPNTESGETSIAALFDMMDDRVKLISITHIPTNSGLVNPVEEIGQIAKQHSCYYLVDACQSVGQYPVDVKKIGCDMLSATGRKYLRGPRGTGFLYVDNDVVSELTPPFLDLHSAEWTSENKYNIRDDARRFENWETNYAGVMGLSKAISDANELGIENIWQRIQMLANHLRNKLSDIDGVTVQDIGNVQGGIVTFTVNGTSAQEIQDRLSEHNINVSTSGKSSTLLDMNRRNLDEVIRASVHYYNTEKEIAECTEVLESL